MNQEMDTRLDLSSIPWPPGIKITPRNKHFIAAYFGPANRVATAAAELAGFSTPRSAGSQLKKRLAEVIEHIELALAEKDYATAREVLKGVTEIARNGVQESNRLKAWDLLARIHGMLSDKVDVNISRTSLLRELDTATTKLLPATSLAPESHQGEQG